MVWKILKYLALLTATIVAISIFFGFYLKTSLQSDPSPAPDQGFTLTDVTIWNPGSEPIANQTIIGTGGIISRITAGPTSSSPSAFSGHFVMPGLIDMHVHLLDGILDDLRNVAGILNLFYGVTTVRDMGSTPEIFNLRAEVLAGKRAGPRIFACGRALDGSKPYAPAPGIQSLASPEEARSAVRSLKDLGADCIKVLSGIEGDTFAAVAQEAEELGLPLIGHIPTGIPMTEIKMADAQHLFGLPEASLAYRDDEVRGDKMEQVTQERIRNVVAHSRQVGMAHTPTLIVYKNVYNVRNMAMVRQTGQEFLPRHYPNVLFHSGIRNNLSAEHRKVLTVRDLYQHQRIYKRRLETIKSMHEAGVRLHLGTDAPFGSLSVPGAAIHEEIAAFREAGLSLEEVLQLATVTSGASLGVPDFGRLVAGAPSDLLIFRHDPRPDWQFDGNLVAVVANGRLYTRELLRSYLEGYQAQYNSFLLRDVLPTALKALFL